MHQRGLAFALATAVAATTVGTFSSIDAAAVALPWDEFLADAATCKVEADVDYVGNDIGSALAKSPEACCGICEARGGCGAYSWTNYNGGTCWLKSKKEKAIVKFGVHSAVLSLVTPPPGTCQQEPNVDYVQNDIANVAGANAAECCAKCTQVGGCRAFSWSNHLGGTCWLKSGKGATLAKSGVHSGFVTTAPTPTPTPTPTTSLPPVPATCKSVEKGIDYVGNDIANVPGPTPQSCCAVCGAFVGCGAFTWSDYRGGTCWLKSTAGRVISNANTVSGIVNQPTTPTPTPTPSVSLPPVPAACKSIEKGIDYAGNDLANVLGPTPQDCCAKCAQRAGCGAFTWSDANGGTCWLKTSAGRAVSNANTVSGIVATASVASPPPTSPTQAPTPTPTPGPGTCSSIEKGADFVGNDLANAPGKAPQDCCAKCSAYRGCGAFTWSDANGGTCWLKSWRGRVVANANTVSGIVGGHIQARIRAGDVRPVAVNLGGWLVAEYWMSMTSPAWEGHDGRGWDGEYVTMQYLGRERGVAQFEAHRRTWITESDIQEIARAGLNTVRVPVGFWIVNDDPTMLATEQSKVFAPGSLKYLDQLINDWAVKYNLAVLVSLHAHQGSQNGYDHSAPTALGKIGWASSQANIDNSLQFATFIAGRYKTSAAFLGMVLMNEAKAPTPYDVLERYLTEAHRRIRATGNDCVLLTAPLISDQRPPTMMGLLRGQPNVWHEFHAYFKWTFEGQSEKELMTYVNSYRATHLDPWTGNKIHLGEWSLAAPDSANMGNVAALKRYAALQLEQYQGARAGWSFWSWRHDDEKSKLSEWSLRQLLKEGILSL